MTQIFITDYDGTLLTDDRTLHPKDLSTLSTLRKKGVLTAIATGRSLFSFLRSLEALNFPADQLPVDYLIFSTGAGIMDLSRTRIIRSKDLSGEDIRRACAYFDARRLDFMVHKPIPDTPFFIYKDQGRENPDFHARIALYPSFGTPMNHETPMFDRATEVLAIAPQDRIDFTLEKIRKDLHGTSVIFATSPLDHSSLWIEVFHRDVSKSGAAAWLCRELGMKPCDVTAVGNDYNDLDLLEWAGQGMVVANSPGDIQKAFPVVKSNNDCGVSEAALKAGLMA